MFLKGFFGPLSAFDSEAPMPLAECTSTKYYTSMGNAVFVLLVLLVVLLLTTTSSTSSSKGTRYYKNTDL
jgi:hypothetical protein